LLSVDFLIAFEIHGLQISVVFSVISQAARQGLIVLMATAEVVLKHETSTTYQSQIYESIDLKF